MSDDQGFKPGGGVPEGPVMAELTPDDFPLVPLRDVPYSDEGADQDD